MRKDPARRESFNLALKQNEIKEESSEHESSQTSSEQTLESQDNSLVEAKRISINKLNTTGDNHQVRKSKV